MGVGGGRGLMVCGTGSDAGKSAMVAGICRLLARRGVKVAPFKAQNMALNSAVTLSGHEIGRAQAAQAAAAGVEAEVAMNPVLLKPTDHRTSQVVVNGRVWATLDAASYQREKQRLWPLVVAALDDLRSRFDVVICEGAGSPAEINLLEHDITNLRVAAEAGFGAVLVGDIDRGGVFASLFGTVTLLPPDLARLIRGFVINKFRGDPDLLTPGIIELHRRTGVPTWGVVPWLDGLDIDAEDSLALDRLPAGATAGSDGLDVAVIRFPRISNFTDVDALRIEPGVSVRLVSRARDLGRPDLIVLPGSKSTAADLAWLRATGLAESVTEAAQFGVTTVVGICGGYQMLGRTIEDTVEAPEPGRIDALGLLPVSTVFHPEKVTRPVSGRALGEAVRGYEIRHGRTATSSPWVHLEPGGDGSRSEGGAVWGTSVHGLFENDAFRRRFLGQVAGRAGHPWTPGPPISFAAVRDRQFDRLADAIETHVDVGAVLDLLEKGTP